MTVRVEISPAAQADTASFVRELAAKAGVRVAFRYVGQFEAVYARLSAFPGLGASRPELGADIRMSSAPPYLVFYRYDADAETVGIVRILHGRRKLSPELLRQGRSAARRP